MSHWQRYHARWSQIHPPLRPNEEVVEFIQKKVGNSRQPVLLLGVTPELADAFHAVHAIDKNPAMIANVWPGNTETKTAIEGNWLAIPEPKTPFHAIVGDGSLNNVQCPDEIGRILIRAMELLSPGGVFVCRLFERPKIPFTLKHLQRVTSEPASINFHAFKWQLAMHLAEATGANVSVSSILDAFNELCPDRSILTDNTKWPRAAIDTIDVYQDSDIVYSFPNRNEFANAIPANTRDVGFHACGTYDMAECCPILAFQKPV